MKTSNYIYIYQGKLIKNLLLDSLLFIHPENFANLSNNSYKFIPKFSLIAFGWFLKVSFGNLGTILLHQLSYCVTWEKLLLMDRTDDNKRFNEISKLQVKIFENKFKFGNIHRENFFNFSRKWEFSPMVWGVFCSFRW